MARQAETVVCKRCGFERTVNTSRANGVCNSCNSVMTTGEKRAFGLNVGGAKKTAMSAYELVQFAKAEGII